MQLASYNGRFKRLDGVRHHAVLVDCTSAKGTEESYFKAVYRTANTLLIRHGDPWVPYCTHGRLAIGDTGVIRCRNGSRGDAMYRAISLLYEKGFTKILALTSVPITIPRSPIYGHRSDIEEHLRRLCIRRILYVAMVDSHYGLSRFRPPQGTGILLNLSATELDPRLLLWVNTNEHEGYNA